jgi:hypothetical protein
VGAGASPPTGRSFLARLRRAVLSAPLLGKVCRYLKRLVLLPASCHSIARHLEWLRTVGQEREAAIRQALAEQHAAATAILHSLDGVLRPLAEDSVQRLHRLAEADRLLARSLAEGLRPVAEQLLDLARRLDYVVERAQALRHPVPEDAWAVGMELKAMSRHMQELTEAQRLHEHAAWNQYVEDSRRKLEASLAALREGPRAAA